MLKNAANMGVKNIKEIKEFIKEAIKDYSVEAYCDTPIQTPETETRN